MPFCRQEVSQRVIQTESGRGELRTGGMFVGIRRRGEVKRKGEEKRRR